MSKIKNALDQYAAGPFKQQQFRTGVERVNVTLKLPFEQQLITSAKRLISVYKVNATHIN